MIQLFQLLNVPNVYNYVGIYYDSVYSPQYKWNGNKHIIFIMLTYIHVKIYIYKHKNVHNLKINRFKG